MSQQAVADFFQKIAEDPTLQTSLAKALEADNDREAVTQLANDSGFEFTADELWEEVQKRQNEFESRQTSGELSDEELEAVAGGASPALTFRITIPVMDNVMLSAVSASSAYQATKW